MTRRTRPDIAAILDPEINMGPDDPGDDIVIVNGRSGAAFVPRALASRLDEDPAVHDAVAVVQGAALTIAEARETIDRTVPVLRDLGLSWASIGWVLGMTAQSAQGRWGKR